jgi:hypothetical protein
MAQLGDGLNGYLDVQDATLRAPRLEAVSNIGIANTAPGHALAVGSNFYVSTESSDVLTVDGNVVCEGVKVGLIEITPSYDLAAVSNVGNATSNTIQFTNSDTGFVTTANATIGKTLTVEGIRITAQAEANDDLQAITAAGAVTDRVIHITNANDSTDPYSGALQIGTNLGRFGGLGVAGNVHVGRGVYTQDLDVAGDAIIRGDLSVLGTTTTIDTDNLRVQDPIIELGKDNTASPVVDLGLIMTRPSDSSNVAVIFDESTDTLELGYTDGGASDTTITMDDSAPLSVNVNGNLSVTSNVEVGTANLFVDTTNSRIGVNTSSPTESLDVVGNMNLQHVSNVASIKLNSNVVTEFPRSKKLIKYPRVALSGPSAPTGYVASASDESSGNSAWEAFDNDADGATATHRWRTNDNRYTDNSSTGTPSSPTGAASTYLFTGSEAGDWISVEFPEKMKLNYYTITGIHYHTPYEGVIYGYNTTTTTWERVSSFINRTVNDGTNNPVYSPEFQVDEGNTNYYSKYAMIVVKTNGHHAPSMYEWKLYGIPEYDPDADGVDVKVTSYPNVPNTDWLEVYYDAKDLADGSTTVNDLTPSGTNDGTANGNLSVSDGALIILMVSISLYLMERMITSVGVYRLHLRVIKHIHFPYG